MRGGRGGGEEKNCETSRESNVIRWTEPKAGSRMSERSQSEE